MAKMYNIREMADAFNGKDYAAQADFGARYPLVATKMAALFAKAPEEAYDFLMAMPEYLTGQKLNAAFKDAFLGGSEESENAEENEVEGESEKAEKSTKKAKVEKAENESSEYASMSCRELLDLITKNKLRKHYFEKTNGDTKYAKATMVKYFEEYGLSGVSEKVEEDKPASTKAKAKKVEKAEDNWDDEEEEAKEDLSSKTPLQLYDICRKRGIKAKTRQPKEYYLGLLKEAEEQTGGPEDWDDSEDVEEITEPKKPAKKAVKKEKPAPKKEEPVEEEDDDDSWDI